jgi:hypothetical protein
MLPYSFQYMNHGIVCRQFYGAQAAPCTDWIVTCSLARSLLLTFNVQGCARATDQLDGFARVGALTQNRLHQCS